MRGPLFCYSNDPSPSHGPTMSLHCGEILLPLDFRGEQIRQPPLIGLPCRSVIGTYLAAGFASSSSGVAFRVRTSSYELRCIWHLNPTSLSKRSGSMFPSSLNRWVTMPGRGELPAWSCMNFSNRRSNVSAK